MHELLLEDAGTALNVFPLGDVVEKPGEEPPLIELDFADRQTRRERGAVLAPADHDATDADDAPLAGLAVARQVGVVGFPMGRGHQHLDVLAHQLGAGIAEEAFRRRVDRIDDAALVDDDDGVWGGPGDRAQAFLAFPRCGDSGGAAPRIRHSPAWSRPLNPGACG